MEGMGLMVEGEMKESGGRVSEGFDGWKVGMVVDGDVVDVIVVREVRRRGIRGGRESWSGGGGR